jgi:putative ABC transport system permease protein
MDALLADLRYGLRLLRKSPVFATVTIGTLALGIGATTAMFSVVDGVLLKPFPVKDQARVLVVWTSKPKRGFSHWPFSYASYVGMRERLRTASGVAAHPYAGTLSTVLHLDDGSAMPLQRTAVTGEWFDVLGVRARAGRLLTAGDDRIGAPHVIVLSSGLARRLFGSISNAVGRRLRVDEDTVTVVGVTPADFEYPRTAEAWVPAAGFRDSPSVAWDLVVRVAPEFTTEQTVGDLTSALRNLPPETGPLGNIDKNEIIHAQPFADDVVGDVRPALLLLGGGVLLMLIVAGVNVANLLIARGLGRRRELSVRTAIGASRVRLLRQLATEAALLAAAAGAIAVFVASMALKVLLVLAPPELPRVAGIGIDERVLAFTAGIAVLAAVLFGILPALQTTRVEPAEALRAPDGSAAPGTRRYWLRHTLVVAQIAISMLVLSTAGLLVRSFDRLQRLDLGFAAQDVFLAEVAIPPSRYAGPADLQRAMARLAEHAATLPGISHVTAVVTPPFAGTQGVDATLFAEDQPFDESANPIVNYEGVDPAYFATLGLPIVRGRGIEGRDRAGSELVVAVNQAFARLFWPDKDPIGRRIKWGSSTSTSQWRTVVGVVADARYRDLTSVRPSIYVPYGQGIPVSPSYLAVRAKSPSSAAVAIRRAVADQEPGAAVVSIEPLQRLLAAPLARPRFQTALVTSFAALAVFLSLVGTYGTLSFFVRQRRREIGIRMALGAAPSNVRRLVLRQGVTMGALGVLLGTAFALAIGGLVQPLLFGVTATDPLVLIGTAASLLAAVLAATLLPNAPGHAHRSAARPAQRVDGADGPSIYRDFILAWLASSFVWFRRILVWLAST